MIFLLLFVKVNVNVRIQSPPVAPSWRSAMIGEMDALTDNGTWDLVCLPAGKKVIGCR